MLIAIFLANYAFSMYSAGVATMTSATNWTFDGLDQLTQLGYEVDWLWYNTIALPWFLHCFSPLPTWHFAHQEEVNFHTAGYVVFVSC